MTNPCERCKRKGNCVLRNNCRRHNAYYREVGERDYIAHIVTQRVKVERAAKFGHSMKPAYVR